jgi:hypothetical protein
MRTGGGTRLSFSSSVHGVLGSRQMAEALTLSFSPRSLALWLTGRLGLPLPSTPCRGVLHPVLLQAQPGSWAGSSDLVQI